MTKKAIAQNLAYAKRSKKFAAIERKDIEKGFYYHVAILDYTDHFVLGERIDHDFCFDGLSIFRRKDISSVGPIPNEVLYQKVLKKKKEKPRKNPKLPLTDMPNLLTKLHERYPLLALANEYKDNDRLLLGYIRSFGPETFLFQEILVNGEWKKTQTRLRYDDITYINLDTEYIRAYAFVGKRGTY